MTTAFEDTSERRLFVLRWSNEGEWAHLAIDTGTGKPVHLGFLRLDYDPTFQKMAMEYSQWANGMREVWFTGWPLPPKKE